MNIIKKVDGVVGMSSTLLYESWLLGIPVLSIQPNSKKPLLEMLKNKKNVEFVNVKNNINNVITNWIGKVINEEYSFKNDHSKILVFHKNSPERFINIINQIIK